MQPTLVRRTVSIPQRIPKPRRQVSSRPKSAPNASDTTTTPKGPIYRLPAEKLLLYADRGLIVVNKPNGLISQLSDPRNRRTEPNIDADIFATFMEDLANKLGAKEPLRPLHRLDKPTTGALAIARHAHSARDFANQLSAREVEKTYLALVVGDASAFPEPHGTIETELECRNGRMRISGAERVYERPETEPRAPRERGENWIKPAVSGYEVLASSPKVPLSLLRLRLHTGVKHQLRVHLAQALRTPVLGDALYLDPSLTRLRAIAQTIDVPRSLFLHSSRISLNRYRPRRVRLAVGAPLPMTFVDVCEKADIPLDVDDVVGGVWVDGAKALGPHAAPDERATDMIEYLRGQWYWRGKPEW
ncbi:pseudouridine synthase [Dichomitus squalens]|uniref:Pseudouridine synthase n=1 Tax=Dichomitus squalens TaxID=114155 RepID=A0A4Q9PN64_9APHY|nr:pseudouridine synthase [Dichomitus squalens]